MAKVNRKQSLLKSRLEIASRVRKLRQSRRWTQAELADTLQLSQNRLSEIERGDGSFTAEQFVLLLKLFNISASEFVDDAGDHRAELQKVLARFGATHLQESVHVLPSKEFDEIHDAVREALLDGSPRVVTAVAAVLVRTGERLNLSKVQVELEKLGRERRLAWVIDNTLSALDDLTRGAGSESREWTKLRRHAEVPLRMFLDFVRARSLEHREAPLDLLDATVRSSRTLEDVKHSASEASRRWGIVTSLQREDFVQALRASHATR
jgi:transcriptional regulator with XRE-family HTH domain